MGRAVCAFSRLLYCTSSSWEGSPTFPSLCPRRLSYQRRRPTHTCCPAQTQARGGARSPSRSRRPGFPALTPPRGPPSRRAPPGAGRAGPSGRRTGCSVRVGAAPAAGRAQASSVPRVPTQEADPGGGPGFDPAPRSPRAPAPRACRLQPRRQEPGRPGGGARLPAPGPARCRAAAWRLRRGRSGEAGVRLAAPVRPRFRPPASPRLAGLPPRRCAAPRPSSRRRSGRPSRA